MELTKTLVIIINKGYIHLLYIIIAFEDTSVLPFLSF